MTDDFLEEDGELTRYDCPGCRKPFDVAGNKWQRESVLCPYCGAEIEE